MAEPEHPLLGAAVRKRFGRKLYSGTVVSYDSAEAWFRVVFEDGYAPPSLLEGCG